MEHVLLTWFVRALVMAAGTAILLRVTGAQTAARHRGWTTMMLAMLMLPAWTAWVPPLTAPLLPPAKIATRVPASVFEPAPADRPLTPHALSAPDRGNPPKPDPWLPESETVIVTSYLAGAAIMFARLSGGTFMARRLRAGARAERDFLVSEKCAAPVTVGWFQPVPLLPECWNTWPAARLDAVLIHEREHALRRDPLVQWLALLNRCVFWFHPLAWWLERKLAALAEEACDEAVLSRGYSPRDYAQDLIEIARSVAAEGMLIRRSGAAAFSAGTMHRRIRRILESRPTKPSRGNMGAALALNLILLAVCLSCNIGAKKAARKSYQSMADENRAMQTEMLVRAEKWSEEQALVQDAAQGLTPARAKLREAELKNKPDQPYRLLELVMYYQSVKDTKALNALTLWFISHHPDVRQDWGTRPLWDTVWDREGYEAARDAWLAQMKQPGHTANFYMNAGEYFSGHDSERAENIFLDGKRKFPNPGIHWEVFLARNYAWALTGTGEQLPEDRYSAADHASVNTDPYANQVRQRLLASNDTDLLDRVVEQLQVNQASAAFVTELIDRMFAIDPNSRQAHRRRQNVRMQSVMRRAELDFQSLSESDKMLWMDSRLTYGVKVANPEQMARDLLALAARNPSDPDAGAATLDAHLILGELALNRGDKAGALRHLADAGSATPGEYLRYSQINMALARRLVDAGERAPVAAFLDRCAKFGDFDRHLADWAAELRNGENPRLFPAIDPLVRMSAAPGGAALN